jgi:hypothetical protein
MTTQEVQKVERLSLPAPINEYPIDIGIIGWPISKTEFAERTNGILDFISNHMSDIRDVLDRVSNLTIVDIDSRIAGAHSTILDDAKRARMAWEVLAWNAFIRPFEHPARQYHFESSHYERLVEKDADALYLYAVFVLKTPSARVHDTLKSLHAGTARQYYNYARNYAIARDGFQPIELLTNW